MEPNKKIIFFAALKDVPCPLFLSKYMAIDLNCVDAKNGHLSVFPSVCSLIS